MISFEHINDFDRLYHVWNHYFRWGHNKIYYKDIQVIGYENVPPKGHPVFVISNHQNAVMDPLAMLYLYKDKRQPVYIARGDIFKKSDFIAKLLRFLKILPTFRTRDGDRDDVKSNLETFDLAARILNEGGTLAMFPEAGHQPGKFFATFKKGFPRVAFRAAEMSDFTLDFKILPMYIYYTEYFSMGAKQVVVIGEPFAIDEFYEQFKTEPNAAYVAMNQKAREAVRSMGIDVTDHEHYPQYDMIFTVCRGTNVARHFVDYETTPEWDDERPYSSLLSDKELVGIVDTIKEQEPERFEQLMSDAAEYREGLEKLRLRDWEFESPVPISGVIMRALVLLLGFPGFLFGLVNNFIPFRACELIKRKLKDRFFSSSINFCVGAIITFPICYIFLFVLVGCLTTWLFAVLYIVASFLFLLHYYYWERLWIKFLSLCRFHKYQRTGNSLFKRVQELRERILESVLGESR